MIVLSFLVYLYYFIKSTFCRCNLLPFCKWGLDYTVISSGGLLSAIIKCTLRTVLSDSSVQVVDAHSTCGYDCFTTLFSSKNKTNHTKIKVDPRFTILLYPTFQRLNSIFTRPKSSLKLVSAYLSHCRNSQSQATYTE